MKLTKMTTKIFGSKRGAELSINTIIIVVLAILVLVIVAVLVARYVRRVPEAGACISKGGVCSPDCPSERRITGSNLCPNPSDDCCSPISVRDPDR